MGLVPVVFNREGGPKPESVSSNEMTNRKPFSQVSEEKDNGPLFAEEPKTKTPNHMAPLCSLPFRLKMNRVYCWYNCLQVCASLNTK